MTYTAQVLPTRYSIANNDISRVNGSSATGKCSSVSHGVVRSTCTDPTSSVLFDGVIPTLTGLDGDMWASHLLTLQRPVSLINIDITTPISRVEVIMFNCPEWGISVQSISLRDNDGIVIGSSGDMNSITSCDSLVRLCVPATAINPLVVTVQFDLGNDSNWMHLAEVTFYDDSTTCPPDTITTDIPLCPTTPTTTTQEMTTSTTPTTPTTTTTTTQDITGPTTHSARTEEMTSTATTPTTRDITVPTTHTATICRMVEMTTTATTTPTTPTTTTTTTQDTTGPITTTITKAMTTSDPLGSDTTPENGLKTDDG